MKAYIVKDEGIPTVTIRDGRETVKTYVLKLDTWGKRTIYQCDVMDPINWYESDYKVTVPRSNKGRYVENGLIWYAMNAYWSHLKETM